MKALTSYAKTVNSEAKDGVIAIYINDKKVATKTYKVDNGQPIIVKSIGKYLKTGTQKISVKFEDTETKRCA